MGYSMIRKKELRDGIRENIGMYIGTKTPLRLLIEVLDNACDEIINGFATQLYVTVNGSSYGVMDNGRGIPFANDDIVLASTELHTSGKFKEDKDNNYKISIGKHGVGLVVVNMLSKMYTVVSHRNNIKAEYYFKNGDLIVKKKVKEIGKSRTIMMFQPDPEVFDNIELNSFEIKYLIDRLNLIKIFYPRTNVSLKLNGKTVVINANLKKYLKEIFKVNRFIECKSVNSGEKLEIYLGLDEADHKADIQGSINLLPIESGEHIDQIKKTIIKVLSKKIKKVKIDKNKFFNNLKLYVYAMLKSVEYSSQEKIKVTFPDKKSENDFCKKFKVEEKLVAAVANNKSLVDRIVAVITENMVAAEVSKIKRKKKKKFTVSKLRDCKNRKGCGLFLVEGDSAGGTLLKCRDNKIHSVLPLRGKPINPEKHKIAKVLANNEIQEMLSAIGLYDVGRTSLIYKGDNIKCKYDKVIVLADPDTDGNHIKALLITIFRTLMPDVIRRGMLYIANVPLYGARKKHEFVPLYSDEERDKYSKKKGYTIFRYKGIGEFDPDELYKALFEKPNFINVYVAQDNKEAGCIKLERHLYELYATELHVSRTYPSIEDGCINVYRRLMWVMNSCKKDFLKTNFPIGKTMMTLHPHGDGPIYGALVTMVNSIAHIFEGKGNWGNSAPLEEEGPAAHRYVEIRKTPDFFEEFSKLFNLATMQKSEVEGFQEPRALVVPLHYCLMSGWCGIGCGAGNSSNIPPYRVDDLIDRTLYVAKKSRKEVKIKPYFGNNIEVSGETDKLLKCGIGQVKFKAKYKKEKNKITILAKPPNKGQTELLKPILKYLEDGYLILDDASTFKTEIEITINTRKKDALTMKQLEKLINKMVSYSDTYKIRLANGIQFKMYPVDVLLLYMYRRFCFYTQLNIQKELTDSKFRLEVVNLIKKLRPILKKYLKDNSAKEIENFKKECIKKLKIDAEIMKVIMSKRIDNLVGAKLDTTKIETEIKEIKYKLKNVESIVVQKYKELKKAWLKAHARELDKLDYLSKLKKKERRKRRK